MIIRRNRLWSVLFILVLMVVAVGPVARPAQGEGQGARTETDLFCGLNEIHFGGQNWVYPGSVGAPPSSTPPLSEIVEKVDVHTPHPDPLYDMLKLINKAKSNIGGNTRNIRILIIDDFQSPIPSTLRMQDPNVVDPLTGIHKASHGVFVREVTEQIFGWFIADSNLALPDDVLSWIDTIDIPEYRMIPIEDDALDQCNTLSDEFRCKVKEKLDSYETNGVTHVIVNMSFAVLPCDFEELNLEFADEETVTVSGYLELFGDSDLIMYDTRDAEPDETGIWIVKQVAPGDGLDVVGLQVGDKITGFRMEDEDDFQQYNRQELYAKLLESERTSVYLRVERIGELSDPINALDIHRAARSYTLPVYLTDQQFSNQSQPSVADWENTYLNTVVPALGDWLTTWSDDSSNYDFFPLYKALAMFDNTDITVISVASAGNFGKATEGADGVASTLPYTDEPLAPGSWENVIAVSGVYPETKDKTPAFNDGEAMAPGAWYKIPYTYTDPSGNSVEVIDYMGGTSFAAPAAGVLFGLTSAASKDATHLNDCDVESEILPLKNKPLFDNEFAISAVDRACANLP